MKKYGIFVHPGKELTIPRNKLEDEKKGRELNCDNE